MCQGERELEDLRAQYGTHFNAVGKVQEALQKRFFPLDCLTGVPTSMGGMGVIFGYELFFRGRVVGRNASEEGMSPHDDLRLSRGSSQCHLSVTNCRLSESELSRSVIKM